MALNDYPALKRQSVCFVAVESTYGELAYPTSSNALGVVDVPSAKQAVNWSESEELLDSRSIPTRYRSGLEAGEWSLAVYARPSGTAGSPPVEDALVHAALGTRNISAGTSVTYAPALELPSLTIAFREGHTTRWLAGAMVGELKLTISRSGAVRWDAKGVYQREAIAGTAETTDGSTTDTIHLESGAGRMFSAGARVKIGDDDNSGQGYLVTSVDTSSDTLSISPALSAAPSSGVVVTGFLPQPTLAGRPLEGHEASGLITLDDVNLRVTGIELSIANDLTPDKDEITDTDYIGGVHEGRRHISAKVDARFLRSYASWFARAHEGVEGALNLGIGQEAGYKLRVAIPKAVMDTPETGGDESVRNISVTLTALATTAGEDEITLSYE